MQKQQIKLHAVQWIVLSEAVPGCQKLQMMA